MLNKSRLLLGSAIEIIKTNNPKDCNLKGIVVYEKSNSKIGSKYISIKTKKGVKKIGNCIFSIQQEQEKRYYCLNLLDTLNSKVKLSSTVSML